MRGYNPGAVIPQRDLSSVKPMGFSAIVKLHPEKEESEYIVMPDSVKRHKDSTRGWIGTIVAVGRAIPRMKRMVGAIAPGVVCMFDESVSIDDPNRCFDYGNDRFVIFDVETFMGILPKNTSGIPIMLSDRVLVRKPKREDFKVTKSKLWIPAGQEKQEVGGVVVAVGPGLYNHDRDRYLPMESKPGDFALFPKYGATDIKIDGIDFAVIRQDKILATVKGEAERVSFT